MTYSANDHPVDTLALVLEVVAEAHDQAESEELQRRIDELEAEVIRTRKKAQEILGESPTQKLNKALEEYSNESE